MTRLQALRQIVSQPRDHADMGRLGRRIVYSKPDGREWMTNPRINRWQAMANRILRRKSA